MTVCGTLERPCRPTPILFLRVGTGAGGWKLRPRPTGLSGLAGAGVFVISEIVRTRSCMDGCVLNMPRKDRRVFTTHIIATSSVVSERQTASCQAPRSVDCAKLAGLMRGDDRCQFLRVAHGKRSPLDERFMQRLATEQYGLNT